MTTPSHHDLPSSPPPSFRSRASSPTSRHLLSEDPLTTEAEQTLADTFDDGEASDEEDGTDNRSRLLRSDPTTSNRTEQSAATSDVSVPQIQRRITELPAFTTPLIPRVQNRSINRPTNDGVFANLAAKPERGESLDEKPPVRIHTNTHTQFVQAYMETNIPFPDLRTSRRRCHTAILGDHNRSTWYDGR